MYYHCVTKDGRDSDYEAIVDYFKRCRAESGVALSRFSADRDVAVNAFNDDGINEVVDWLNSTDPSDARLHAKLDRMTWSQAAAHAESWHERLARRNAKDVGDPNALEVVKEFADGIKAVRVTSQAGCEYEGAAMGHCVGNSGYFGRSLIYSIRDGNNNPHATLEVVWDSVNTAMPPRSTTISERRIDVVQIKGRANKAVPTDYRPAVRGLLDILNPRTVNDLHNIGCVILGKDIVDVTLADAQCDGDFLARLYRQYRTDPWNIGDDEIVSYMAITELEAAGASPYLIAAAQAFEAGGIDDTERLQRKFCRRARRARHREKGARSPPGLRPS